MTLTAYILSQEKLNINKTMLRKIYEFKMPSLLEVKEHVLELYPEVFLLDKEDPILAEIGRIHGKRLLEDIEWTYVYHEEFINRLKRRLSRYIDVYLAMAGLLDLEANTKVLEDLKELDIDLKEMSSVESGRERVAKSFCFVIQLFTKLTDKVQEVSFYFTDFMCSTFYVVGPFSDDERYGEEVLCKIWSPYEIPYQGFYVEPTKKQIREFEEEYLKRTEEVVRCISSIRFEDC